MTKEKLTGIPLELQGLKELLNTKFGMVEKMESKFREIQKLKSDRLKLSHDVAEIEKLLREKCRQ